MSATETSNATEANQSETDNLDQDGLMNLLMKGNEPEAPELPESEAEEAETEEIEEVEDFEPEVAESDADEVDEEPEEPAEEEEEPEAEDEIDLTALSPEEIQDLAKRGKSRLLDRVGKLTAEKRALEAKLNEAAAQQPVKREIPQDQNPFKDLESFDDIKTKYAEVEQTLEQTDILLEEHEDYAADDVIVVGSQEFTKKQLRQANRNARDAMHKFLPAQAEHLKKRESFSQATEHWNQQAVKEVPEIQDEDSEFGKQYQELLKSPNIKKIQEIAPEAAVDVGYILAHALRSIRGETKPKVPKGAGKKLKVKPPASPVGAGAAKQGGKSTAKVDDLLAQFQKTGNEADYVAYQTAKMLNQ
jgi:hypothetical protein